MKYSIELRLKALKRIKEDQEMKGIAEDLHIPLITLYRWKHEEIQYGEASKKIILYWQQGRRDIPKIAKFLRLTPQRAYYFLESNGLMSKSEKEMSKVHLMSKEEKKRIIQELTPENLEEISCRHSIPLNVLNSWLSRKNKPSIQEDSIGKKVVKLVEEGQTITQIKNTLGIRYNTAWYHANKYLKKHGVK